MATKPDSTRAGGLTSDKRPALLRHLWPILLGLAVGSALYAGYRIWTGQQAKVAAAAVGDPSLARPTADECAMARTVIGAVHASGDERRWLAGVGESAITLDERSHVFNPVNAPGVADDEAENLRSKGAADWRWCPAMGAFVAGLGWKPMAGDEAIPELGLGRPGLNTAGDEAKMYESFISPEAQSGAAMLKRGPWVVTLHRGAGGAWQVTATTDLPRPGH